MGALYDAYEKSKTGQVGNDQRSLQQVMDDYSKQHNRSAMQQMGEWFAKKLPSLPAETSTAAEAYGDQTPENAGSFAYQAAKDLGMGAFGFSADMLSSTAVGGISKMMGKSDEESAKLVRAQRENTAEVIDSISKPLDISDEQTKEQVQSRLEEVFGPFDKAMRTTAKYWVDNEVMGNSPLAEEMIYNAASIATFAVPGMIGRGLKLRADGKARGKQAAEINRITGELHDAQKAGNVELANTLFNDLGDYVAEMVTGKEPMPETLGKIKEWLDTNRESLLKDEVVRVQETVERLESVKNIDPEGFDFLDLSEEQQAALWEKRRRQKYGEENVTGNELLTDDFQTPQEFDAEFRRRRAQKEADARNRGVPVEEEIELDLTAEWESRKSKRNWSQSLLTNEEIAIFDAEYQMRRQAAGRKELVKQSDSPRELLSDPVTPERLMFEAEWTAKQRERLKGWEKTKARELEYQQAVQEVARRAKESGELRTATDLPLATPSDIQLSLIANELKNVGSETRIVPTHLWDVIDKWEELLNRRTKADLDFVLSQEQVKRVKVAKQEPVIMTVEEATATPTPRVKKASKVEALKKEISAPPEKPAPIDPDMPPPKKVEFIGAGRVKASPEVAEYGKFLEQIHSELGLSGEVVVFGDASAKIDPKLAALKEIADRNKAAGMTKVTPGEPVYVYVGQLSRLRDFKVTGEKAHALVLEAMANEAGHVVDVLGKFFLEAHEKVINERYTASVPKGDIPKPEWFAQQVSYWLRLNKKPFTSWQKVLEKAGRLWQKGTGWVAKQLTGKDIVLPDKVIADILDARREAVLKLAEEPAKPAKVLDSLELSEKIHQLEDFIISKDDPLALPSEKEVLGKLKKAGFEDAFAKKLATDFEAAGAVGLVDFFADKKLTADEKAYWAMIGEEANLQEINKGWSTHADCIPDLIDAVQHNDAAAMTRLLDLRKADVVSKAPKVHVANFITDGSGNPKVYNSKVLATNAANNARLHSNEFVIPIEKDGKWYLQKEEIKGDTFFLQIEPEQVSTVFGGMEHWERLEKLAQEQKMDIAGVLENVVKLDRASAKQAGRYIEKRLIEWRELDPIDIGLMDLPKGEGAVIANLKEPQTRTKVQGDIAKAELKTGTKKKARKRKSADVDPDAAPPLEIYESWVKNTLEGIQAHYEGKAIGGLTPAVIGHAFTTPVHMFKTVLGEWGTNFFMHPEMRADAAAKKRTRFYVNQIREWSAMNKLEDGSWIRIMQHAYTKRPGGIERLKHSGLEPLKYDQLSPAEQRGYEFAKTFTEKMFAMVNDTRAKLGKRPLKPDIAGEDWFTFLGRVADTGVMSKIFGGKAEPTFKNPALQLGSEVMEHLQKAFPQNPTLKRVNKAKVSWFEKRYSPDTLNEAIVYEVNGRKILEHYVSAVIREAHMAPLFAVHSAVMNTALNPKKVGWLADKPASVGRLALDKGDPKVAKALRNEIRKLPAWERLHAVETGKTKRFTMRDELLDLDAKMREAYGAGELKHLSVEQLTDLKKHLSTGSPMTPIEKKVLDRPYVIRDEHSRMGYMVNQWLLDAYEGRTKNITDNHVVRMLEDFGHLAARKLSAGMILGKIPSMLNQSTSIINTATVGHMRTIPQMFKMLSPATIKETIKASPHLQLRLGGNSFDSLMADLGRVGDRTKLDTWNAVAGLGVQAFDAVNAIVAWKTGESVGRGKGLTGRELVKFADEFTLRTQGSGRLADRAPIQRTKAGATLTALQTFTIANANFILRDVIGYRSKGVSFVERGYRIAALMGLTYAVNQKFRDAGLYPPSPDIVYQIKEAIDNEEGIPTAILRGIKEMATYVPLLSSLRTDDPRNSLGPLPKALTTILKGLGDMPDTFEKSEDFLDFLKTLALSDAGKSVVEMQGIGWLSQILLMGRAWDGGYEGLASYIRGVDAEEKQQVEENKPGVEETAEEVLQRLLSEDE